MPLQSYAYPQWEFEEICKSLHWDDTNVESLDDKAFISILDYDDTNHYFKQQHHNVLNIEFADVGSIGYKHITQDQIQILRNFIEKNKGKNFMIHCVAGQSRSVAVAMYIYRHYEGYELKIKEEEATPNWYVLSELERLKREEEVNIAFGII